MMLFLHTLLIGVSFLSVFVDARFVPTIGVGASSREGTLPAKNDAKQQEKASNPNPDETCDDDPMEKEEDDDDEECFDVLPDCLESSCIRSFSYMRTDCRKTCSLCDNVDFANTKVTNIYSEIPQLVGLDDVPYLAQVDKYMYEQVFVEDKFRKVRNDCKNRDELCIFWAALGECENNPKFMEMQCAPSCFSCEQLSFETRCPFDKAAPKAWSKAGDLDAMFTRIVTDPAFQQYNVTILSQPNPPADNLDIFEGPWVVYLDDFLTHEECDILRDLGADEGYERSEDVGEQNFDGTFGSVQSSGRTSSNACTCKIRNPWLQLGRRCVSPCIIVVRPACHGFLLYKTTGCTETCAEHNVTIAVHERMQDMLQIPSGNYEYLQMLKCTEPPLCVCWVSCLLRPLGLTMIRYFANQQSR